ncbi:MAG: hypothetical protein IT162_13085 [Bryobacterales bacterium]|nr:hypothetical protein [Bryobacterales bacterium]
MKKALASAAVAVVGLAGCSSSVSRAKVATPPAAVKTTGATQVHAAMERQVRAAREVRNAVDAGEGDFEARQLRQQMAGQPGNLEVRLRLAARYEALDLPELAQEHYRLAAERFPGEAAAQLSLARSLHRSGRTAEAASGLEGFLSAYPEAPAEAHSWAGILRDSLDHHQTAERHHRAALDRAPEASYLHNNLGQNLALQARPEDAVREFRAALERDPANGVARNNLAAALGEADPQAALALLAEKNADQATVHSNLAALLIERGKYADARRELNLALGYDPAHTAALANLRMVSELDGKPVGVIAPPRAAVAATGDAGANPWRAVGRRVARLFRSSETRQPEQPVARGKKAETRKTTQLNGSE